MMEVSAATPLPLTVAVQVANGLSNPPAGTLIENVIDDPETVPDTVPRPVTPVPESVIVIWPENDAPDCVSCHVMTPRPDALPAASYAEPVQVPAILMLLVGVGEVGGGELLLPPPPPPQAIAAALKMSAAAHTIRVFSAGRMDKS